MKKCTKCGIEKSKTEYQKDKRASDGLRSDCKVCVSKNKRAYYQSNIEKILENRRAYYQSNIEKITDYKRNHRQASKEKIADYKRDYYQANADKLREKNLAYRRNNHWRYNANNTKSRSGPATPTWLTSEHLHEIAEWYKIAKELQWLSEEPLHVDHIVPLNSEIVCGLHVPWNLQILPRSENRKKGNKLLEAA